jgi:hypothetical protein
MALFTSSIKKIVLVCLLLATINTMAQKAEQSAIKQTINNLFIALQQGDSVLARTCFDSTARLQTALINPKTGITKLENESVAEFLQQIAKIQKSGQNLEERITSYDIKIDLPLASVWATYEFYINEHLSHKGVDAFQLFKTKDGWKIIQICDTRKKNK